MAATIAHAYGRGPNSESHASRLGAESAKAQAATFKTFATAEVQKDGSGSVMIEREIDGERKVLGKLVFGPEDAQANQIVMASGGPAREVVAESAEESAYAQSMREFDRQSNGGQW